MNNQSRAVLASADPRVQAALKDYLDRLDNGKPMGLDEFMTLPTQVAEELRAILANNPDIRKLALPDQNVVKRPMEVVDLKPDRSKTTTHSMSGQSEGTLHEKRERKVSKVEAFPASRSREDLPEVFGRYRIEQKLGSGAMGAVYLAEDSLLHRKVALKTPTFSEVDDGDLLKRFYREARAVANLKHPNLCAVYDVGQIDGRHYISMEFVPGKKLQEFIKPDKPMSEKQAMAVVRKIALGMHEAHSHHVIHRDLKPDNIMINGKGEPVVMDFGLVHKTESKDSTKLTQHGSLIGSPAYMSKEQVEGDPDKLTAATDQYSLGVILYQLLTSRLPFEGGIHSVLGSILTKEPPPPSQHRSDINPHLEAVCLKMMAKEAKDRYASMKAAADAIAQVAKGASIAAGSVAAPPLVVASPTTGLTDTFAGIPQDSEQNRYVGPLPNISVQSTPVAVRRQATTSFVETRRAPAAPANRLLTWWSGRPPLLRWSVIGSAGALSLVIAAILYFQTPYGVLQIEIDDPSLSVTFDGNAITVDSDGQPIRVTATANHTLEVLQNGIAVESAAQQLTVKRGENRLVKVSLLDGQIMIDGQKIAQATQEDNQPAEPTQDWIELSNGRDLTGWVRTDNQLPAAWKVENGYMEVIPGSGNIMTSRSFPLDFQLHVEFWIPNEVNKSGQPRGNSGIFLLGRHEIQIVDVFENPQPQPAIVGIGALFNSVEPKGVIAKPPETWQTFDITFHAPRFDAAIGKDEPGRLTVKHDGKIIVDNAEVNEKFGPGGSYTDYGQPGPICLQDHFSPVRFRNIRMLELPAGETINSDDVKAESKSDLDRVATGTWRPLIDSTTVLPDPEHMKFQDGVLELDAVPIRFENIVARDIVVRAEVRKISGENVAFGLRNFVDGEPSRSKYGAFFAGTEYLGGDFFGIGKKGAATQWIDLNVKNIGRTFESEQFVDMAFSAVGQVLTLYVEGQEVLSTRDNKYEQGFVSLSAHQGVSQFRNVEYQILDQPAETDSAVPAPTDQNRAATIPAPAVAPFNSVQAKEHQEAWAKYLGVPVEYTNSIAMKFVLIPPGEFMMGSTTEEIEEPMKIGAEIKIPANEFIQITSETPQHHVILTQPFYLGAYEVTQGQYEKVMVKNPSHFASTGSGKDAIAGMDTTDFPVDTVSWYDAAEFCTKLNELENEAPFYLVTGESVSMLSGTGYRLPTEAEWEFSCRSGSVSRYWCGTTNEQLAQAGWFEENSEKRPHRVGELNRSPFGLYDIHGNVWEWVQDSWDSNYYGQFLEKSAQDPTGSTVVDSHCVNRGGDWIQPACFCRATDRGAAPPVFRSNRLGFRAALMVDAVKAAVAERNDAHEIDAVISADAVIPTDAATFQQKRFKFFSEALTWHVANQRCQEMGGRLAEVRSREENDFIAKLAISGNATGVWLGATDELEEGKFRWSDGSELTFKNWSEVDRQPNGTADRDEDCLLMMVKNSLLTTRTIPVGDWFDQPDAAKESGVAFICEWDGVATSPTESDTASAIDNPEEMDETETQGLKKSSVKRVRLPVLSAGSKWEGTLQSTGSKNAAVIARFVVSQRDGDTVTMSQANEDGSTYEWDCVVNNDKLRVNRVERSNTIADAAWVQNAPMGGFKPTVVIRNRRMVIDYTWDLRDGDQRRGRFTLDLKAD